MFVEIRNVLLDRSARIFSLDFKGKIFLVKNVSLRRALNDGPALESQVHFIALKCIPKFIYIVASVDAKAIL